ncbi:Ocr-like antirestriction protein [Streptomyces phage phiScoe23]|nr:Ocr-like antirestriction protein [Streptomyces phage phiScoe23]
MTILNEIKEYGAYRLARLADTGNPAEHWSAGAKLLTGVRDSVIEAVEYELDDSVTLAEAAEAVRDGDSLGEIADGAPSIYTAELWNQFHDLSAWQEDLEELGGEPTNDLNKQAGLAVYLIAYRLASVLLEEIIENDEEN